MRACVCLPQQKQMRTFAWVWFVHTVYSLSSAMLPTRVASRDCSRVRSSAWVYPWHSPPLPERCWSRCRFKLSGRLRTPAGTGGRRLNQIYGFLFGGKFSARNLWHNRGTLTGKIKSRKAGERTTQHFSVKIFQTELSLKKNPTFISHTAAREQTFVGRIKHGDKVEGWHFYFWGSMKIISEDSLKSWYSTQTWWAWLSRTTDINKDGRHISTSKQK